MFSCVLLVAVTMVSMNRLFKPVSRADYLVTVFLEMKLVRPKTGSFGLGA